MALFSKASTVAVVGMLGVFLAGAPVNAEAQTQFIVHQAKPDLAHVNVGDADSPHGDMLAFAAEFSVEDGTKGMLSGVLITIDLPGDDGNVFENRIGQLVFDFGATDRIVVAGDTRYAKAAREMNVDQPQVRAVIGGTGRFLGARGQVTTERKEDGSYEHAFELIE